VTVTRRHGHDTRIAGRKRQTQASFRAGIAAAVATTIRARKDVTGPRTGFRIDVVATAPERRPIRRARATTVAARRTTAPPARRAAAFMTTTRAATTCARGERRQQRDCHRKSATRVTPSGPAAAARASIGRARHAREVTPAAQPRGALRASSAARVG
jgi:hypothetical protein